MAEKAKADFTSKKITVDEDCMIALDSVGKKLGFIVNCNSKTENLLGF